MAYTSEQYKYLLFRRLQRHFSMENPSERYYTQNFFGKLFDESVTVTEESYNKFVEAMDYEMQYCFDNNIYNCSSISESMIESHQHLLIEAFASIDVDLVIEVTKTSDGSTSGGNAIFTKPNGEVMVYEVRGGWVTSKNNFTINTAARTEYNYAKLSAPYYNFEVGTVFELDEYNPMTAGDRTYWSYNADTKTMTITGDGTYVICPTDTQVGGGDYSTIILGANVSKIATGSIPGVDIDKMVLFCAPDIILTLSDDIVNSVNDVWTMDVYCDNESFRNYGDFPSGLTVRWHALDEWDGGISEPLQEGLHYNSVFLPEFKNVRAKTYPYILIGRREDDGTYVVICSKNARRIDEGDNIIFDTSSNIGSDRSVSLYKYPEEWKWRSASQSDAAIVPIWANYDILNIDGTICISASAPVRNGVPLDIIACSYMGVELQVLPERDVEIYPYASIVNNGDGTYYLYYSGSKAVSSTNTLSSDVKFTISGNMLVYKIDTSNNDGWTYVSTYTNHSISVAKNNLQWSNYELKYNYVNTSGTSYTSTQIYADQTVPSIIYG